MNTSPTRAPFRVRLQVIRASSPAVSPILEGTIELHDGRRLSYSAAGPPRGYPIAYLHGAIGSPRWWTAELEATITGLGIRYVVVNRPGFGGSDGVPGRTVAAHARDVEAIADALGWNRFSVIGVSAGAPYALACAWALGDRIAATAMVSPLPPPAATLRRGRLRLRYRVPLAAFATPGIGPLLAGATLRTMRLRRVTPPRSMIEDYLVCCRPWGFDPAEVRGPVSLWHARHDRLVPPSHVRRLAAALPAAALRLEPRGGHFFFRRHVAEILEPLVAAPAPSRPVAALRAAA
jgi:pimeloyl-ACP methyl ester carboxylesterase